MLTPEQVDRLRARIGRTGTTVTNHLFLKPGLNGFMGTVARGAVSESSDESAALDYTAQYLARALGYPAEYIGRDPTGITNGALYNIGFARPVHFWLMGETPKRREWYNKAGAPVGPDVYYVGIAAEWRGPSTDVTYPVDNVAFPGVPKVIPSASPDGDLGEQRRLLRESALASGMAAAAAHASTGVKLVDEYTRENFPIPGMGKTLNSLLVLGSAAGILWWFLEMKRASLGGSMKSR